MSALFEKKKTGLLGCYEIQPLVRRDQRGCFVKIFHASTFRALGLATDFCESYYSVSQKNVIRGLHFQMPPHDHAKLVTCLEGRILDVAVYLRCGSPSYGAYHLFSLEAEKGNMVYLPSGMAHGFCTLTDRAMMLYQVTSEYDAASDSGIRWDSVGIPWPVGQPILSERDQDFVTFDMFQSPFSIENTHTLHPRGRFDSFRVEECRGAA